MAFVLSLISGIYHRIVPSLSLRSVDTTWRRVMDKLAKSGGEVLAVTGDEELLRSLNEANGLLEQVGPAFFGDQSMACSALCVSGMDRHVGLARQL